MVMFVIRGTDVPKKMFKRWRRRGVFRKRTYLKYLNLLLVFFRYYFKKVSDEFDCGVVFEEVREDDAVLPIFEEKIIGKVEKID